MTKAKLICIIIDIELIAGAVGDQVKSGKIPMEVKSLAHVQLADRLRSMIEGGEFLPGQTLPSTKDLAKRLDTYGYAVHRAMSLLSADGLVARKPHVGTVVTGASTTLKTIGVYITSEPFTKGWTYNFTQSIFMHLSAIAHAEGISLEPFIDTRKAEDSDGLIVEFTRAAKARKFQAVMSLSSDIRATWIEKLGMPFVSIGGDVKARVGQSHVELFTAMAERFVALGCRSAALITTLSPSSPHGVDFLRDFSDVFKARGIELKDEWIRHPVDHLDVEFASAFGYQQMNTLWQLRERPQGVAVYPDIAVPGVVCAALKLGLDGQNGPAFIFHKNKGNAPFCPLKATWFISDPGACAKSMFTLLRRQIAGESPSDIILDYEIES